MLNEKSPPLKPTYQTSQFAIFDDVLSPGDAGRLLEYIENEECVSVHSRGGNEVWRIEDGSPLYRARGYAMPSRPLGELVPREEQLAEVRKQIDLYPTKTPVDTVLEATRARAQSLKELVGEEQRAWLGLVGKIYVYPAGTCISWHSDSTIYSGAFIYYAHPAWSVQWGGELLIADPESADLLRQKTQERRAQGHAPRRNHFTAYEAEEEAIMKNGYGQYVMPKPNRLVILSGRYPHMMTRVSAAAGNRSRLSIAGFFLTAQGLANMTRGGVKPSM